MSSPIPRLIYRVTHWGDGGERDSRVLRVPDPDAQPLVELGELVSIGYLTKKLGDGGPAIYDHDFLQPFPILAFSTQGLFICGGGYKVGVRGIIG